MQFADMFNTKLLFLLGVLFVYMYLRNNKPIHNSGELEYSDPASESESESENTLPENIADVKAEVESPTNTESDDKHFPQNDYATPEDIYLKGKFSRRNKAYRGPRKVSYSEARRGNFGRDEWKDFINRHNNILADGQKGNEQHFVPMDETNGGFASFSSKSRENCGSNQDCSPEELFDADKYLPQEVSDDWFEVQPEPVSVKNRHLINVTKPVGINTIGSSQKNASYDIRGTPACPKFVVSPWLQSSIEPDHNLKSIV